MGVANSCSSAPGVVEIFTSVGHTVLCFKKGSKQNPRVSSRVHLQISKAKMFNGSLKHLAIQLIIF